MLEFFTLTNIVAFFSGSGFLVFLAWVRGKLSRGDFVLEFKSVMNEQLQIENRQLKIELQMVKCKIEIHENLLKIERDSAENWQKNFIESLQQINKLHTKLATNATIVAENSFSAINEDIRED